MQADIACQERECRTLPVGEDHHRDGRQADDRRNADAHDPQDAPGRCSLAAE